MHHEVEQKFPLTDSTRVVAQFNALGAVWREPIELVDSYFALPARDFATTDEALRIRRVGEQNFVTYKGPKLDALTKTRREIEIAFAAGREGFEQLSEMLLALGFRRVADVRKLRRPGEVRWNGQSIELALDQVEGVGSFLELEISAEPAALDAARQTLLALAEELGLPQPERRSYLEMLLQGGR